MEASALYFRQLLLPLLNLKEKIEEKQADSL